MEDQDDLKTVQEKTVEKTNIKPPKAINCQPRKKWPWIVGALVFVFIVCPVLVLGWLGFVPGLSSIMGADKPRDLGVTYTEADYESYQAKTGGKFLDFANAPSNPDKPFKKLVFGDPKDMAVNLTQEEITATINMIDWAWMPVTNAQVRLGDGTVEISGNLNMDQIHNFINFIGGVGYDDSSIRNAIDWGNRLMNNPPIYIKTAVSVTDNILSMQVQEVQVGRFSAPMDVASKVLNTGTENSINNTAGLDVQSATLSKGELNFSGSSPTVIYVKH